MQSQQKWNKNLMPGDDTVLRLDVDKIFAQLETIPDEMNALLRQVDGKLSCGQLLAESSLRETRPQEFLLWLCQHGFIVGEGFSPAVLSPATAADFPSVDETELEKVFFGQSLLASFSGATVESAAAAEEDTYDARPTLEEQANRRSQQRARGFALLTLLSCSAAMLSYLVYQKIWLPQPLLLGRTELPAAAAWLPERAARQHVIPDVVVDEKVATENQTAPPLHPPPSLPNPVVSPLPVPSAPVSPDPASPEQPGSLLQQALTYEKKGKLHQAALVYRTLLQQEPNHPLAQRNLAFLLLNWGDNREAATMARGATQANPRDSKAWITLGAALQGSGDFKGARQAYVQCVAVASGEYVAQCKQMLR